MITMTDEKKRLMEKADSQDGAFGRLVDILRILRQECPWDKKQTHESLVVPMIEEAYEAVDAINEKDMDNLKEELGDVQLQVLFHSILAEESDCFTLTDVLNDECEKMIRRHPHIFGEEAADTVDKVLEKWENIKEKEHIDDAVTDRLKRVPKSLPALVRSYKVQDRAAQCGFDWDDISGAFEKVSEESGELKEAYQSGSGDAIGEELGDLLFSVVNVARFLEVEPEDALRKATEKFILRFQRMEDLAASQGKELSKMSLMEMDALWATIKHASE